MDQLNEAKNLGDAHADLKTEQGLWQYVETQLAAEVRAGDIVLRPHWKGAMSPSEIRDVIRLASAAPALYEIVRAIGDRCTNMYAGQRCPLGFKDSKMWCLPCRAVAVLALVNKPDTNSANSIHPAHGQASKTEVQK